MKFREKSQISCENRDGTLYLYHHDGKDVRMITIDNESWWVLADLCRLLGLKSNPTAVSKKLAETDVKKLVLPHPHYDKPALIVLCVNERALGYLIARSDRPAAAVFHEQVFGAKEDASYGERFNELADAYDELVRAMNDLGYKLNALNAGPKTKSRKEAYLERASQPVTVQMVS